MAVEAESAVRRVSQHAEHAFGLLQNAGMSVRLIGQEADRLIEIMADTRLSVEGTFSLNP